MASFVSRSFIVSFWFVWFAVVKKYVSLFGTRIHKFYTKYVPTKLRTSHTLLQPSDVYDGSVQLWYMDGGIA